LTPASEASHWARADSGLRVLIGPKPNCQKAELSMPSMPGADNARMGLHKQPPFPAKSPAPNRRLKSARHVLEPFQAHSAPQANPYQFGALNVSPSSSQAVLIMPLAPWLIPSRTNCWILVVDEPKCGRIRFQPLTPGQMKKS